MGSIHDGSKLNGRVLVCVMSNFAVVSQKMIQGATVYIDTILFIIRTVSSKGR